MKDLNFGPGSEAAANYERDGYLVVEDVFSPAECDRFIAAAEARAEGHFHNYLDFHETLPDFKALITDKRLLSLADQLHQHRMVPIGSIFFFCKPGNPLENGSAPHQDNYAPKSPFGSYFVMAVAFADADEGNGSLVVYPGTHKLGDLPAVARPNFEFDASGHITKAYPIGNDVKVPDNYKPLTLRYKKGAAIFIHGHIVHEAPKNPSPDRWRQAIYMHYIKDGHPFWPGWNAKRQLIDRPPYLGKQA